jgi:hypothetical protein
MTKKKGMIDEFRILIESEFCVCFVDLLRKVFSSFVRKHKSRDENLHSYHHDDLALRLNCV